MPEKAKNDQKKRRKFNLYNLFNPNKDGPGVDKEPPLAPTLRNFFKIFYRNMSPVLSTSIALVIGNFSIFLLLLGLSGWLSETAVASASPLFGPVHALSNLSGDPSLLPLVGVHGSASDVRLDGVATYVMYGLGAGLLLLTFGPVSSGASYILRNVLRREPVFFVRDFFHTIKKNVLKSILFGVFDLGVIAALIYNIFYYSSMYAGTVLVFVSYAVSLAILILFLAMRMYFYLQIVSFDLGFFRIVKNSFILACVGFRRNLMAFIGTLLLAAFIWILASIYLPLGIIMPFILCGFFMFVSVYAAWPVIDKYIVRESDPSEAEH